MLILSYGVAISESRLDSGGRCDSDVYTQLFEIAQETDNFVDDAISLLARGPKQCNSVILPNAVKHGERFLAPLHDSLRGQASETRPSPPMSSAPRAEMRRQQHRDEARRAILDAAAELTSESSFSGFSVRSLVDRCGYSAPTIYHYFGDKPGLLDALVEDSLETLVRDMEEVPISADPIETLRALTLCFGNWGLENPTYYHLLTQPRAVDAMPLESGEISAGMLSEPFSQLVEQGRINESETELLRQSLWACLHGLISLPAIRADLEWNKDLLETSVDRILRGWLSSSSDEEGASQTGNRVPHENER